MLFQQFSVVGKDCDVLLFEIELPHQIILRGLNVFVYDGTFVLDGFSENLHLFC